MNPTEAATSALVLATDHSKGQSKLCSDDLSLKYVSISSSTANSSDLGYGVSSFLKNLALIPAIRSTIAVSVTEKFPSDQLTRLEGGIYIV